MSSLLSIRNRQRWSRQRHYNKINDKDTPDFDEKVKRQQETLKCNSPLHQLSRKMMRLPTVAAFGMFFLLSRKIFTPVIFDDATTGEITSPKRKWYQRRVKPPIYHLQDGPWVLEHPLSWYPKLQRGLSPPQKNDWSIPALSEGDHKEAPSFCGEKVDFIPFAKNSISNRALESGRGTRTFFRVARPDLIDRVAQAVDEIDKSGDLDQNSYCEVFESCEDTDKMNRHSKAYLACNEQDKWIHSSNILQGVARNSLPGSLGKEGDSNVLCEITKDVTDMVSNLILKVNGLTNKKCIVQEQFINQQRNGSITKRHVHYDDTYGALFYLDTPPGSKMCFSNSEGSIAKNSWWSYAPQLTENLYPDAPGDNGVDYPGFFEPRTGDIVFFPVGWLAHWVPRTTMESNEKRTSVVFNMICI